MSFPVIHSQFNPIRCKAKIVPLLNEVPCHEDVSIA